MDGRPWRSVPDEVVVRTGLVAGMALDRSTLRRLRTELGRAEGFRTAGRALARRDLTRRRLAERLGRAGVAEPTVREVVATLAEAGLVDDERLAFARARSLAERGYGDAAIGARLEAEGIEEALVAGALEALPPERERAAQALAGVREPMKAARRLQQRGFEPETVEEILGPLD